MKRTLVVLAVAMLTLLAACGDSDEVSAGADGDDATTTAPEVGDVVPVNVLGSWIVDLVIVDGVASPQPNDDPATVLIEVGGLSGDAGCNRFFGEWSFTAEGGIEIGQLAITEMACMGRDDWFEVLQALTASTVVTADGDARVLANADGSTSIRLIPEGSADAGGTPDDDPDGPDTSVEGQGDEMDISEGPADAADYIGLAEAAAGALAEERGHPWRVSEIDGEGQALTMDFNENRYNFSIDDGLVTAVTTG
ncbi:MAG: META domain-containing protein [Actinomycetota bacterium]|nr:META domain-containing protein [Actinomycetota bacterium]